MLQDEMERQGHTLFRWRSYLPLMLLPLMVMAFVNSGWMTTMLGSPVEEAWDYLCLTIALAGLVVRVVAVGFAPAGTSGRNTDGQRADRLNSTGLYATVRHPLYLGNFLTFLAFVLLLKSFTLTLFGVAAFFIYYERIMLAEEGYLASKFGEHYRKWAARTPLIVPRLNQWTPPSLPFSWKTVIGREFHGEFLIATVFFVSEVSEAMVLEQRRFSDWVGEEPIWLALFVVSAIGYLAIRMIRKRTHWLLVAGR